MRIKATMLAFLGSAACVVAAFAQPQPAPPAAARTVIATAKLPSVIDKPMNFRAVSIGLKSDETENLLSVTGVVYQVSGSAEVLIDGKTTPVAAGTGVYIPAGTPASLTAKGGDSATMVFQLIAAESETKESGPATVKELFRTVEPLPGLTAGTYDLNLTRVTFPAGMPSNAPHHRTGGALYYVISGTGANTIAGMTYQRGPGVFIYEPAGLVHQWGNPGAEPLTFVTLNINQEGVPAVAPETPAR